MITFAVKARLTQFNRRIELSAVAEDGVVWNTWDYDTLNFEPTQAYNLFCADTNKMYPNEYMQFKKAL